MTVTGRKPGGRYSLEQRQEDRSEGQLKERFAELGWPCDRLGRDLGEDLNVRIYDDGASSGLTFLVQLKSTADSGGLKRKRSPTLAYDLEVKDLLHWEVSTTLVVLVVWDVKLRTGWWRPIKEIMKDLDATTTAWRDHTTAAVSVPLTNGTDDAGLVSLRRAIANHSLPLVPKPDMEFSLVFAQTEEGKAVLKEFERALDMGEAVTFEKGFIPEVEYPSWHTRIYGPARSGRLVKLEIRPTPQETTNAVRVEVDSAEGPAAIPYVELRSTVRGRKRGVLSNEHQNSPMVFSFLLEPDGARFAFTQARTGNSLYEAREAAGFMLATAAPDSVIRVVSLRDGKVLLTVSSARATVNRDLVEMREWRDVLDKLIFIQQRVAGNGAISMDALEKITTEDIVAVQCLFQILREGRVEVTKPVAFKVVPSQERLPDVDNVVRFDWVRIFSDGRKSTDFA